MQTILSIAGSDSGAGAGIQADLKTGFSLNCHVCTVVTAITAQNTQAVSNILVTPTPALEAQLNAVLEDFEPTAIKIGMLGNLANVQVIAKVLNNYRPKHLVWDPVLKASTGQGFLDKNELAKAIELLLPLCSLITPNLPEARIITDTLGDESYEARKRLCEIISERGTNAVLLKGGHLQSSMLEDMLFVKGYITTYTHPKLESRNTHGTGCVLSTAIAANLALGQDLASAVKAAIDFLQLALNASQSEKVGQGNGPALLPNYSFHKTPQ